MTLYVFSDSHGHGTIMKAICADNAPLDGIIHLGDGAADADPLTQFGPVYAVRGNCDRGMSQYPLLLHCEWEGVRVMLCHGHRYGVKSHLEALSLEGRKQGAQVVLFGHTHNPCVRPQNGILLCNPGSIARPRAGNRPSYGVLDISSESVSFRRVHI